MLLKHSKYQDQQEYRILWELDTLNGTFIDVIAPRARQFCRKVDAAEYQAETIAGQRQHLEPVEGKPSEPETGIERRCINAEVHFS